MLDYLMRVLYSILAFLLLVYILAFVWAMLRPAGAQTYSAGIPFEWRIVDGDTISTKNRPRTYYRILGYDAPETFRPRCDKELLQGTRAKEYFSSLLASPNLTWFNTGTFDRYGRSLVQIWIGGKTVADLMVKANYGVRSNGKSKFDWCLFLKRKA